MAGQVEKPKRKRQQKNEAKPVAKRQKRDGSKVSKDDRPIYYLDAFFPLEMLTEIAGKLNLKELFELGRTSPGFGTAVEDIYGKNHNRVPVYLHLHSNNKQLQHKPGFPIVDSGAQIDVYGLEPSI